MAQFAELTLPLLNCLDGYCKAHATDCPLGACIEHPETIDRRSALYVVSSDDAFPRELVRDSRCNNCTLVRTLQSIQRNVPTFRVEPWLDEPQLELKGRTPRSCLEAGDFDPVINALWLLDQSELTCG